MLGTQRGVAARLVAVCALACLSAACVDKAPATQQKITEFNREVHAPRILLMPVDIELSELTAGGLNEPKADWTEAARENVREALRAQQAERGNAMIEFDESSVSAAQEDTLREISKLHGVVGSTIALNRIAQLPTKAGKFDWSLGPDVRQLRERYDADYALFLYVRDSYASSGRVALIVVAAIARINVQAGQQVGYASLVDLNTGDIVWFNRLARPSGDLRTREPAQETVRELLKGLPK
jgi:hypothetical protein